MKVAFTWGVVALTFAVAGCGGGSAGEPNRDSPISPTPTAPAPAPSPIPQPSQAAPAPTLLTLAQSGPIPGYLSGGGYFRDLSTGRVTYVIDTTFSIGTPVIFDAALQRFGIQQVQQPLRTGEIPEAANLMRDEAASDATFSILRQSVGNVDYRLKRLNLGAGNPLLGLVYTNLALSTVLVRDAAMNEQRASVTPLVFGLRYDRNANALSGSGSYVGTVVGIARAVGSDHVYEIGGTITLRLTNDYNNLTAEYRLTARDDVTGQMFNIGTRTFTSSFGNGATQFVSGSESDGRSETALTGPTGEELMGAFRFEIADPLASSIRLPIAGAYAAKRQ